MKELFILFSPFFIGRLLREIDYTKWSNELVNIFD